MKCEKKKKTMVWTILRINGAGSSNICMICVWFQRELKKKKKKSDQISLNSLLYMRCMKLWSSACKGHSCMSRGVSLSLKKIKKKKNTHIVCEICANSTFSFIVPASLYELLNSYQHLLDLKRIVTNIYYFLHPIANFFISHLTFVFALPCRLWLF